MLERKVEDFSATYGTSLGCNNKCHLTLTLRTLSTKKLDGYIQDRVLDAKPCHYVNCLGSSYSQTAW